MLLFLSLILSYLLGSVPTAYIFAKLLKGIDIRQYGSGNIGATNVFRVIGKLPGIIVLFLDILKGYIPVIIFPGTQIQKIFIGLAAIAGHNWPIFLKFRGGKGVATSAGVVIGLIPKISLLALFIWIVSFLISGYVSLSSLIAALSFPILCLLFGFESEIVIFTSLLALLIVYKHRPNIKRLAMGEEKKIFLLKRQR